MKKMRTDAARFTHEVQYVVVKPDGKPRALEGRTVIRRTIVFFN